MVVRAREGEDVSSVFSCCIVDTRRGGAGGCNCNTVAVVAAAAAAVAVVVVEVAFASGIERRRGGGGGGGGIGDEVDMDERLGKEPAGAGFLVMEVMA